MTSPIDTAAASMLIRKPIGQVYQALVDPSITTKFWFTHSTGPLTPSASITWTWDMYNLDVPVKVLELKSDELIIITWGENEYQSKVTFDFKSVGPETTYVTITNSDFHVTGQALIERIIDATGGFNMVIAGLKSWLEHGIQLNLIRDKMPKELSEL